MSSTVHLTVLAMDLYLIYTANTDKFHGYNFQRFHWDIYDNLIVHILRYTLDYYL